MPPLLYPRGVEKVTTTTAAMAEVICGAWVASAVNMRHGNASRGPSIPRQCRRKYDASGLLDVRHYEKDKKKGGGGWKSRCSSEEVGTFQQLSLCDIFFQKRIQQLMLHIFN